MEKATSSLIYRKAAALLGIDLRSLAVFRISLGVLILYDLLVRAAALTAHYTDAGVLPREVLYEAYPRLWFLSLHVLGGSAVFQGVLFVLAGLAAVALAVGYRTRLATVLSWGLMLSLHVRNPAVLNSGDTLFLLLLFWSMFLPLGARFSIDAARGPVKRPARSTLSVATLGLLLQVFYVYYFSALWKTHPVWMTDATAVYFALSLDRFTTTFGQWLLHAPSELLRMLTKATWWLELVGPVLAFFPVWNGPIRTAVAGAFMLFHVGLGLALELGIFPYVCIAAWLVFLPGWFWDVALPRLPRPPALGNLLSSRRPARRIMQPSFAVNIVAALAVWYIGAYNMYTLDRTGTGFVKHFQHVTSVGKVLNLNQTWRMFAPRPSTDDGWYVTVGVLKNGEKVDVFRSGTPVRWSRPELISATYKDQRWRKYAGEHMLEKKDVLGPLFASHLWRRWNERHEEERQLKALSVYLMHEKNLLNHKATPVDKRLIAQIDSTESTSPSVAGLAEASD